MNVEKDDAEAYKKKVYEQAELIQQTTRRFKPVEEIEIFYSDKLKRLFISERVNITRTFPIDDAIQ